MITARSKGFQLLDNNIEVLRLAIESLLNKTKGPEGKRTLFDAKESTTRNLKRQKISITTYYPLLLQIIPRVLIMVLG